MGEGALEVVEEHLEVEGSETVEDEGVAEADLAAAVEVGLQAVVSSRRADLARRAHLHSVVTDSVRIPLQADVAVVAARLEGEGAAEGHPEALEGVDVEVPGVAQRAAPTSLSSLTDMKAFSSLRAKSIYWSQGIWCQVIRYTAKRGSRSRRPRPMSRASRARPSTECGTLSGPSWQLVC